MPAPALEISNESIEGKLHSLVGAGLRRTDGDGPAISLGARRGALLITVAVYHVVENTKLGISIWGSQNGEDWGEKPLLSFPPKSYCGNYTAFLEVPELIGVRYLRVSWTIARSASIGPEPFCGFSVVSEEAAG